METSSWINQINDLGAVVGGTEHLIDIKAEPLIDAATTFTGFSDFGDNAWQTEFDHCVDNLQSFRHLGVLKFLLFKYWLFRCLRNRLLIVNAIKQTPAIRQQTIQQPLIITGMGRTGTSILFELLALDPRLRAPTGYEAMNPIEPPATAANISHQAVAKAVSTLLKTLNPGLNAAHEINYELPTECFTLMGLATVNFAFCLNSVKPYAEWHHDLHPDYYYYWHKTTLQVLQSRQATATWLLKCPYHLHFLTQLLAVYPDARIIHTHRDPLKAIRSSLHLAKVSPLGNTAAMENYLSLQRDGLLQVIAQRENKQLPGRQCADVHYQQLISDPINTIKQVYDHFGMTFSDNLTTAMTAYLANKPSPDYSTMPHADSAQVTAMQDSYSDYLAYYQIAPEV